MLLMLLMLDHNYNVQYVTSLIVLKDTLITEQYTRLASGKLLLSHKSWSIIRIPRGKFDK